MLKCESGRVWILPDGSIMVTRFYVNNPASRAKSIDKLFLSGQIPPNSTFVDYATESDLNSVLPLDRSNRDQWRMVNGKIVADLLAPKAPNPKQPILDEVDSATTIASLKAVLRKIV